MPAQYRPRTVIGPLYEKLDSLHPSPSYDACITQGKSTTSRRIPTISLLIDENLFGETALFDCLQCYLTFRGIHHDSFFDAYPILPTPSLLLVCANALAPDPSFHGVLAQECQMLIDTTTRIPLPSWATPHPISTNDLDLFFASFLTNLSS